jgi:hypothetical protein
MGAHTWHRGAHRCEPHGANIGMRGGEMKEGPPNEERGDGCHDPFIWQTHI